MTKLKVTTKSPDEKAKTHDDKSKSHDEKQRHVTKLKVTTKLPPSYHQVTTTKLPPNYHKVTTTLPSPNYHQMITKLVTFSENGEKGRRGGSWELTGQMCGPKHLWILINCIEKKQ